MLREKLQADLKESMIAKNEVRTSTIRLVLSALKYFEIQKGGAGYVATDEEILEVVSKEAKKRKESLVVYKENNRQDLVDKEQEELDVLQKYLPEQMSEAEIRTLVQEAIQQTGATSPADMGKVMGTLVSKTKGKADGSIVSRIVREELSKN
jgi:uncharacterized protein